MKVIFRNKCKISNTIFISLYFHSQDKIEGKRGMFDLNWFLCYFYDRVLTFYVGMLLARYEIDGVICRY